MRSWPPMACRAVRHEAYEIDHLIPLSIGGSDDDVNARLTKPAFVACDDLRQQVLARQSEDELRQMVRRHIIDDRRRQGCVCIIVQRRKCLLMPQGNQFVPKMPITRTSSYVHGPPLGGRGAGVSNNRRLFQLLAFKCLSVDQFLILPFNYLYSAVLATLQDLLKFLLGCGLADL